MLGIRPLQNLSCDASLTTRQRFTNRTCFVCAPHMDHAYITIHGARAEGAIASSPSHLSDLGEHCLSRLLTSGPVTGWAEGVYTAYVYCSSADRRAGPVIGGGVVAGSNWRGVRGGPAAGAIE